MSHTEREAFSSITLVDPVPQMLEALREALPILEAHTPRLSTSGTMVRVCELVRDAIRAAENFDWAKRTLEAERAAPAGPRDGLSGSSSDGDAMSTHTQTEPFECYVLGCKVTTPHGHREVAGRDMVVHISRNDYPLSDEVTR